VSTFNSDTKKVIFKMFSKFKSLKHAYIKIKDIKIAASLNLLKENALKADFKVEDLSPQKLIKKKEVKPINSQPKKKTTKLPEFTKIIILIIKELIKEINLLTCGSYLK